MNAIEAKNLKKVYKSAVTGRENTVFADITVDFEQGKLAAIFGPSGSGKTTFLNLLGLLDTPTSGSLAICGEETATLKKDARADRRRDRIGFVFQSHYLNQRLTVKQNMILPLKINKKIRKSEYDSLIRGLLSTFGMEEFIDRYPDELSGGEQQRVCIARALANDPDIILADEPTGNLDGDNERTVLEYLKGLTVSGKTVIIVTHNEMVKEYSDMNYHLSGGILEALD
ncbi:MAG: ABC transporter ATP-binding protein [Lachnospiraceae bacterium]|nr:ABC transporter ATP-binding protein [Lachnospiraceae bacterium]